MEDQNDILGLLDPTGALRQRATGQARGNALTALGLGLLRASRGQPGQGRPSTAQAFGEAGPGALQAYQQSFDKTLADALRGLQVKDVIAKQAETRRIQDLASKLPVQGGGINQEVANQLMTTPAGMDYLSKFTQARRDIAGKTELVEIFSPTGQPMKVRYNVDTGQYTPVGGQKAEPFVQVDRGNVIELRNPSGGIIGTLSKGAAPTAPSFSMTETGQVLNTRTGQVFQPTDAQGNPIVIDQSAKATEGERLSSGFYLRMSDATSTFKQPITGVDGKPILKDGKVVTIEDASSRPELVAEFVGAVLPKWMGGQALKQQLTSAVREQYEQAQENWITANLRKESGAVIGPEEMQKEIRKWFPVVGNSPQVIEQKRKARIVAEDSMRRNAGRALTTQPSQQRNLTVDY
jgi:hypothetical protein